MTDLPTAHTSNMQSATKYDPQAPLATFILLSYNQERFIQQAVRGALSQTYEPLEIIISDDCSTDRTFELAQEMVRAYSGPHKIRLNRNAMNIGISRHVRSVQEMATGEIIIHAGGDDISYPDRTARVVNAFRSEERTPSLVMSNAHVIDEDGNVLGLFSTPEHAIREENVSPTDFTSPGGAGTFAVHRGLVTMFPPPADEIYGEDRILLFRAKLASGTLYIPQILVQYRVSRYGVWSSSFIGSLGTAELLQRQINRAKDYIHIMDQGAADVRTIDHPNAEAILKEIGQIVDTKRNWVDVLSGSLRRSSSALMSELLAGRMTGELAKLYLMRWMPLTRTLKLRMRRLRGRSEDLRNHPAVQVPQRK